jgi:ABC-type dipeptide/oligopeptide/nickel transport system permease component
LLRFIVKKLLYGLLVLAGVVVLVNILFVGLGDPVKMVAGDRTDKATLDNIRKNLRMDSSRWKSFVMYLNDVSPIGTYTPEEIRELNIKGIFVGGTRKWGFKWPYLRRSMQTKKEVSAILLDALPGTLMLALAAMLLATVLGIFLGVVAAVKQKNWVDTTAVMGSIAGISAPSFFMGIIIAYVFGFVLSDVTGLHFAGSWKDIEPYEGRFWNLKNLVLPAITLGIRPLAIITQLTRSAMLDVLDQDYIRTAYAKGLTRRQVIWKHGLRNALNPVITAITGWFAELLAGAFFVEYIFGWKGIGKVTVDALEKLDFPVVMGSVLLTASIFIVVNIIADILYGVVDPRIRARQ